MPPLGNADCRQRVVEALAIEHGQEQERDDADVDRTRCNHRAMPLLVLYHARLRHGDQRVSFCTGWLIKPTLGTPACCSNTIAS